MIAVHHEHEGKRPRRVGIPHAAIHRQLGEIESPILLADLGLLRIGGRRELRPVDHRRFQRDRVAIDRAPLVGAAAVVQRLHREAPLLRRIRRGEQLAGQHRLRVVVRQLERRHTGPRHERGSQQCGKRVAPPVYRRASHEERPKVRADPATPPRPPSPYLRRHACFAQRGPVQPEVIVHERVPHGVPRFRRRDRERARGGLAHP